MIANDHPIRKRDHIDLRKMFVWSYAMVMQLVSFCVWWLLKLNVEQTELFDNFFFFFSGDYSLYVRIAAHYVESAAIQRDALFSPL